ncbi:hypothetical protein MMC06_001364 [Schaereria dolodes]|nr:hypothetical protein [Schaereria dolodes]
MSPRILLAGGHGKLSLLMTPKLLARSWDVTSVIRNSQQSEEILSAGNSQPGKIDVLVRSLEEIKTEELARIILDEVKPDYVVWSAGTCPSYLTGTRYAYGVSKGAGGKGGSARTYAIDRDAARHFIKAAVQIPSVTKFLMVSYIGSRRRCAPWWNEEEWASTQKVNTEILADYFTAKVDADECLTALSKQMGASFKSIILRPGTLTDDPPTGKVSLGKTKARGKVSRADVADIAVRLLASDVAQGWYDLLEGEEEVTQAVERVVREKIDCVEGEDIESMLNEYPISH